MFLFHFFFPFSLANDYFMSKQICDINQVIEFSNSELQIIQT